MAFQPGFTSAALSLEGQMRGEDAMTMRTAIDQAEGVGDGDGRVSSTEVIHFVFKFRSTFEAQVASAVSGGNMTLDARPPSGATLGNVTMTGAEGATNSLAPITTRVEVVLSFEPGAGPTHTLLSKAQPASAGPLEMTVRAPAGYVVASATGVGADAVYGAGRTSILYVGEEGVDRVIVLAPVGSTSTTAPSGAMAMLALGTALLVRRVQAQK